ncbi:hypothetical protein DFH06DRAFT_973093, partial [Mycena polygramma]
CPTEAPEWFRKIFPEISREGGLPAPYWELLCAYLEFEQKANFENRGELAKGVRPKQVSDWVRDGRGRTQELRGISDIKGFEAEWWTWWTRLQPAWREPGRERRKAGKTETVPEGANWGTLASPGKNGILSVVASLYWWAVAEREEGKGSSGGWEDAVADTTWVVRGMKS